MPAARARIVRAKRIFVGRILLSSFEVKSNDEYHSQVHGASLASHEMREQKTLLGRHPG
jgi:hypothetical protein